jgi:hypothetical protein
VWRILPVQARHEDGEGGWERTLVYLSKFKNNNEDQGHMILSWSAIQPLTPNSEEMNNDASTQPPINIKANLPSNHRLY